MKYKLAFVNECKNYRHTFWYKPELRALMLRHDMEILYKLRIEPRYNNRWTPEQIFACLEGRECLEVMRLVPYITDREFGEEYVYQEAIENHFGVKE